MPVGYLIPVLIVAIGTWCALRPVPWEHPLGRPSYLLGLAANELPFAAFFWMLLVPTAMAFAQDDVLDSPGAWGVVALAALT
ncbi:alpha/beta hydrolase, partial [Streptomyces sp. DT225]